MWEKDRGIAHKDHESSITKTASSPGFVQLRDHSNNSESQDYGENKSPNMNAHRRSASADFCQTIESDLEKLRTGQMKTSRRELPARPEQKTSIQSVPSFSSNLNSRLGGGKQLPVHLLSAKNEQKTGVKAKNQIPSFGQQVLKLAASANNSGTSTSDKPVTTGTSSNIPVNSSSSGHLTGSQSSASLSSKSHPKHLSQQQPKSSSTSSLSGVLKLAEPGGKGRSSSLTSQNPTSHNADKGQGQKSASVDAGNSQDKKKSHKGDNNEIYFWRQVSYNEIKINNSKKKIKNRIKFYEEQYSSFQLAEFRTICCNFLTSILNYLLLL